LPVGLDRRGGWADTVIRPSRQELTDVLTGRSFAGPAIQVGEILGRYPVALLVA